MAALIEDTLPAALASRLNDEQRQAFTDAPRGGKLTALAIALAKSEADLLTEIAGLVCYPLLEHIEINSADDKQLQPAKRRGMITDHSPTRTKLSSQQAIKPDPVRP